MAIRVLLAIGSAPSPLKCDERPLDRFWAGKTRESAIIQVCSGEPTLPDPNSHATGNANMTEANDLPISPESKAVESSTSCSSCCPGMMKAVLYTPVVLLVGALAAVAMYPDLADYGYPLIGKPSHIGFTGESACSAGRYSTSCPSSAGSCCSEGISMELISSPEGSCCPTGRSFAFPAESTSTEERVSEESVSGETASAAEEQAPADAVAPLNTAEDNSLSN